MKIKVLIIFIFLFLFLGVGRKPAFALEHTQKDGLFSMDIPAQWHWSEYPQEIVITYPDGTTMAIEIQMVPSPNLSPMDIKKALKDGNDKMIRQGIDAHRGELISNKEIKLGGVYATQLDFKTVPPNPIFVRYISFFNKGYVFTITYGSEDEKMREVMDDAVSTFKFK